MISGEFRHELSVFSLPQQISCISYMTREAQIGSEKPNKTRHADAKYQKYLLILTLDIV